MFWVPALLRLGLMLAVAGIAWWLLGPISGLALALLITLGLLVSQLAYLHKLGEWLNDPQSTKLPDGWGAWKIGRAHV